MTQELEQIFEKLRNGELEQHRVNKAEFIPFRDLLVQQADRENFRGEAKKGGDVLYTYVKSDN